MEIGTGSPEQPPPPLTEWLARHGEAAALASGGLAALGALAMAVATATANVRLGAAVAEPSPYVRMSDALVGVAALAGIPVAFRLSRSWRRHSPIPSGATLATGVSVLAGYSVVVLTYAAGVNRPDLQGPLTVVAIGGIGLWLLMVSLGSADAALGRDLRRFGLAVAAGNLLLLVAYFSTGGTTGLSGQQLSPEKVLILAAYAVGSLTSELGYPAWALCLGKRWHAAAAEVAPAP